MTQNKEYSVFGRQVGFVIAANIATLLLGFIRIPILTKGLGADLYGTWSLITVTISLITPFAMLGFGMSIVRFLSAEKDDGKVRDDFFSACTIVFISGAVFALLLLVLADYLAAAIFKDAGAAGFIRLGSVLILLNSLYTVISAFFRMRRKIGLYTTLNLSQDVLQVGLVVSAILLGYSLGGVITAFVTSGVLMVMFALFLILRQTGFQVPRFSNMKSYLKWGVPLTPNTALMWIIHVSDRYMISYFLGVTAAGIYSASYAIGDYASFALTPLITVLFPYISKKYDEGNLGETQTYLKYSLKYLMMIAIPSAFGLSILAKPLLQILTTPEFFSGSIVIPWVAFSGVFFAFRQICNLSIYMVNKTQISIMLLGTSAVLNVILNLILIPRMGIVGAAVATLIAYAVLGMLTLMVTRRYLRFDLSLPFIGKSILASAVMTLCIRLIDPESILLVIITILAGAIIYFGVLFLLRGFSRQEIRFFTGFVRDNIRKGIMLK